MISVAGFYIATGLPVNNPGYLCTIPAPLYSVDTSAVSSTFVLRQSFYKGIWLIDFNFNKHPVVSLNGKYVTAVEFTTVSPNDNSLVITSSSAFANNIGVILSGGTVGKNYSVTVGATLNDSNSISSTLNILVTT